MRCVTHANRGFHISRAVGEVHDHELHCFILLSFAGCGHRVFCSEGCWEGGQERLLRALPALGKCRRHRRCILVGHVFLRFPPLLSTGRCSEFFLFRPSRLRLPAKAACRLGISHTRGERNIKSEQSDVPEML